MNSFFARRYVITGIFVALCLVLLVRLFYMQIMDDKYLLASKSNVVRRYIVYPARGPILDRHGKIMVQNVPVFDITVLPREVKPFDTTLFCKLLGIDKEGFDKRFNKAVKYSPYLQSVFEKQVPLNVWASFQERLPEFPGFDVQRRTMRTYPDSTAAQFLGYIGEVTDRDIEKSGGFYRPGDYIGRSGVERAYEDLLRGQRGVRNVLVDSRNVQKGSFANGAFDTSAVAGERLISSLDSKLQKLGEQLMKNKVGSIVAIEPSTGEILAFVSSPTYDPNIMVEKGKGNVISAMYNDPYSPFLVRPIQAYYSPGSSFKPLDALIALQEGIITPQTTFFCPHYYQAGNHRVGCEHFDGVTDLRKGISQSCNTYFCNVFDRLINAHGPKNTATTYGAWREKVNNFGFGVKLDVDLPHERRGLVPTPLYYDNRFGKNHWRSSSVISLAIGQGELLATPLQMANIECTIANRGFYFKPHLIKAIGDKNVIKKEFTEKHYVGVDSNYFHPVIDGMQDVVDHGTAADSRIPGIVMCGKTGTVQNPHGKNHSVFVGFAPRDNPKIAIAVVVENAGYGASWAAPIASFMVEKYLKDSITRRPSGIDLHRYMNANLLPPTPAQIKAQKQRQDSLRRLMKDTSRKRTDTLEKPRVQLKSAGNNNRRDTMAKLYAARLKRREDAE
ncbi:penicillin-binding protein 2 [Mucilaginibacter sp. RS28]|uniref:Penicillin-binding protein 2 n=1 Tax=Mucilaginibacter straminoryzae TaxID=2932774 RepID=A0A9X2B7G7_9SPHI|nr:penicillin-binding protein 2 [Mucilaginibacter straminoryzae]MCJ8208544.1 penicillin-binding protein 2 [Mucilaginibacter straminoryzae]